MNSAVSDSTDFGSGPPPRPSGWKAILKQVFADSAASRMSLSAAGCAFFATLSLFPALTALISLYGLMFDVQTVEPQLEVLRNLLPASVYGLIVGRIHTLVAQPHASLTFGLVVSLAIALWSASASSRSIIAALNMAYHAEEKRGVLQFQFLGLSITIMTVIGACLTLALMVAAPAIVILLPHYLQSLGISVDRVPPVIRFWVASNTPLMVEWLGPSLMLFFMFVAVSLLYRFAPCRDWTSWRWVLPGAVVATLLWVVVSLGFSWYVSNFASYGATYGPLGAAAAVMMWLFVSAYVVLVGGVINAEIEERARRTITRAEMGLSTEPTDS